MDTTLRNPHSMHFHGVKYKPSSDGAFVPGFSGRDGNVKPGQSWTYRLTAAELRGRVAVPRPLAVDAPLARGRALGRAVDPRPPRARARTASSCPCSRPMQDFQTINGRAFVGNTPVLRAKVGERVQWDVLAIGSEHHTFHVHGHRWRPPRACPRTRARSARRRASGSPGARTRPARGSTTATWSSTWRPG